jgi:D-serine deaminase-like pyridoxal phosphate-dependent protein
MKKNELITPAILLDMDVLENNINSYQAHCNKYGTKLWPMIKTHKSSALVKMQMDAGAAGFLCGTLDECEMVCQLGAKHIMYAYPTANPANIQRVLKIAKDTDFIIRLDTLDAAEILNAAASDAGVVISYTIIVDMDFHRFGIPLDEVVPFAKSLASMGNLRFRGISTHPGQVYGCTDYDGVKKIAKLEMDILKAAADALAEAGFPCELITSGSTPTFKEVVEKGSTTVSHPGNYTFFDNIQMALGVAEEKDCAMRVMATVISNPREGVYLFDAGAKCLGLDQGAHGNSAIQGFGYVVGHPELTIVGLSEEVAKVTVDEGTPTNLKVGDKVEIIPNHSCSSANNTTWFTLVRGDEVVGSMEVDCRGNNQKKF